MEDSVFKLYQNVVFVGPAHFAPELNYGDVGAILEVYDGAFYEVEFVNNHGSTKLLRAFPEAYLEHFVTSAVHSQS